MRGPIHAYMARDDERVGSELLRAEQNGRVNRPAYERFRLGLLRHIALEFRVLIPLARRTPGGAIPRLDRIFADHALFMSLVALPPTRDGILRLREQLAVHDLVKQRTGGLYDACDRLLATRSGEVIARLRAMPATLLSMTRGRPRPHALRFAFPGRTP